MVKHGIRAGVGAGQAAKRALQWLVRLNYHTEVSIEHGDLKGKKAIIIARYKNVSLIEFYSGERIYLDNFKMVKLGRSKIR